jgi:AraC-like DNA-binding protein
MLEQRDALSLILTRLRLRAAVSAEPALCGGNWAVDTSGDHAGTFHVIQSGTCWLHAGDADPEPLEAGDVVLFPRDSRHLLTPGPKVPPEVEVNEMPPLDDRLPITRMLCGYFEFPGRPVWPLLNSLPDVFVFNLTAGTLGDTRSLLTLLLAEADGRYPGRSAVIDQLVHVLIVHALRQHVQSGVNTGLMAALAHPRIGRALESFHGEPSKRWTVETLAAEANMSRAAFSSAFREVLGDTPMSYVSGWRMQVAVDQLSHTDLSVARIAASVGYESEAAFRNAFRRIVGQTPGSVRRAGNRAQ